MIRKLLICPWFGPLPEWFPLWHANIGRLREFGFDVVLDTDEEAFAERAHTTLDVDWPTGDGRKVCDYRCAFGVMYADELKSYDFWGHTDLDCVYGRVERYVTDEFLAGLDLHSNHPTYVSGPWSLYLNDPAVNVLFTEAPNWREQLSREATTGWVETSFSELVGAAHQEGRLTRVYTNWQTQNLDDFRSVRFEGDALLERGREVMMAHFRRTKVYPEGCRR